MNHLCISSLVVQARPATLSQARDRLSAIPGVEVVGANAATGKLVVVLDASDNRQAADRIAEIRNQAGILSATLVYQFDDQFESEAEETA